jgi:hypothetical protein
MKEVELSGKFRHCDRIVRLLGACMGPRPAPATVDRTLSQAAPVITAKTGAGQAQANVVAQEAPPGEVCWFIVLPDQQALQMLHTFHL